MRRLILALCILFVIVVLTHSQVSIHIGGTDGKALLENLTNRSLNMTGANNTSSNLSVEAQASQMPKFIGNGGKVPLQNLTNSSLNLPGANNNTSDLSTWGGNPRFPPPPSDYSDYQNAQYAQVIKANRVE